jgi:hypothetical protein
VNVGVLNVVGGPRIDRRLGANREGVPPAGLAIATILGLRYPSLIETQAENNVPGIVSLDGMSTLATQVPGHPDFKQPYFNENMPLRDGVPLTVGLAGGTTEVIQSPVTNTVAGAMAIQQVLDNWEWVAQPSNPVAYAPHLRKDPLPGVSAKSVLIQFAKGDPFIPNPDATAFLRAGDLADRATFYRYDLAFPGQDPNHRLVPA